MMVVYALISFYQVLHKASFVFFLPPLPISSTPHPLLLAVISLFSVTYELVFFSFLDFTHEIDHTILIFLYMTYFT